MLAKLKKSKLDRSGQGFTIIEVMIVLAIAGLILLIVFLAVPALQRSSRNTQRKSDVGRIASAATTVLSDNDNAVASLTTAALDNEIGNLSYYQAAQVSVTTAAAGGYNNVAKNPVPDTSHVVVVTGAVCAAIAAGGQGATTANAQNTSVAVLYSTETGGAQALDCASD
jgi:prepilin-type N-terminal cleavage/methylation domain-containing protein